MDDQETTALLDQVDAVRQELSSLYGPDPFECPVESTSRHLVPLVLAVAAGLVVWYAVRLIVIENDTTQTPVARQTM